MTMLVAAALAAASVATLVAMPRSGQLRLDGLIGAGGGRRPLLVQGRTVQLVLPLAGLGLVVVLGVAPALLAAAVGVTGWRWRRRRGRRQARAAERSGAVEACSVLAGELQAGRSPSDALRAAAEVAAGPLASTLRIAGATAGLGGDVATALRSPPPGQLSAVPEVLRALSACWSVCAMSGSGLAAAVARLEEGLRAEQAQRRAVDAELAGPRATAALLALLPLAGLVLAGGLGADPLHVLLHTPAGLVCLVLGVALDGLGVWWTARLVDRAGGAG